MELTKAQALPFHEVLWLQDSWLQELEDQNYKNKEHLCRLRTAGFLPNIDTCLNLNVFVPPEKTNEDL